MRMDLPALTTLLVTLRLSGVAQGTPMDAFRGNIAAIHARDRAAYLSHSLHSPELARVGPDGLRLGYDEFARGAGEGWPDTLVATHLRIVAVSPDVAYGVYRYRVVDTSGSARGVSERVFVRTPAGWKVAVTTAFPTPGAAPPPTAFIGATLVDGTGAAPVRNAVVLMRDGRVACAGPRAACPVPPDADTVSAAGKWIIPGLVDTHVHFSQSGWVDGRPDALDLREQYPYDQVEADLHARPERFFRSYLCSGVTSVFDVGGYPWTLDLQARTAHSTTAPRVLSAGPLLSTIDFWLNLPAERQFIYMRDAATMRQAVRAREATHHNRPRATSRADGAGTGAVAGEPQAGARRGDPHRARDRRRQPAHAARGVRVHGARGNAGGGAHPARGARGGDAHRGPGPGTRQHGHGDGRRHGGPRRAGRGPAGGHPERPAHRARGAAGRGVHAARARVPVGLAP